MSSAFHILKHEHRVIERGLRALEGICIRLRAGVRIPADDLNRLVDFIGGYADGYHHAKEENYLFPALKKPDVAWDGGALDAIGHEHKVERNLLGELRSSVERLRDNDPAAVKVFVEVANRYISHLLGHMRHEDALLFRLAEEVLEPADKDALFKNFKQAEKSFGTEVVKRYEDQAAELEEKWAV